MYQDSQVSAEKLTTVNAMSNGTHLVNSSRKRDLRADWIKRRLPNPNKGNLISSRVEKFEDRGMSLKPQEPAWHRRSRSPPAHYAPPSFHTLATHAPFDTKRQSETVGSLRSPSANEGQRTPLSAQRSPVASPALQPQQGQPLVIPQIESHTQGTSSTTEHSPEKP